MEPETRTIVKANARTARQLPNTGSRKENERRRSESASTRKISAEGSPRARRIRMRALRHAGSPQRVRRAQDKLARRRSKSVSTRRIYAKGSLSSCTACKRVKRCACHEIHRPCLRNFFGCHAAYSVSAKHTAPATKKTHGSLTECCAAIECCGDTQIRRSARRHSESAILKKGPFHAKPLVATTAMALELRLSKRRSLTRQEAIAAWRPCHEKNALCFQKRAWCEASSLKKHTPRRIANLHALPAKKHCSSKRRVWREASSKNMARTSQLWPSPAKKMRTAPQRAARTKTAFYAQGQSANRSNPARTLTVRILQRKHYLGNEVNVNTMSWGREPCRKLGSSTRQRELVVSMLSQVLNCLAGA